MTVYQPSISDSIASRSQSTQSQQDDRIGIDFPNLCWGFLLVSIVTRYLVVTPSHPLL